MNTSRFIIETESNFVLFSMAQSHSELQGRKSAEKTLTLGLIVRYLRCHSFLIERWPVRDTKSVSESKGPMPDLVAPLLFNGL